MNLFNIFPNVLNPVLVSRLDGNIEAAILLTCLDRWVKDKADDKGWADFTRNKLCELTGLSENKIKISERFLKKRELLKTKTSNGIRLYKVDYIKAEDLSGYKLKPSLLEKLDNNAKAALLLTFYLEFHNFRRNNLMAGIPSKEIELTTGMKENAQIYARDSLLGMDFLKKVGKKNDKHYVLNYKSLVEKNIVVIEDA